MSNPETGYPQKSLYNHLQQQQEEQSDPPSQPHPPQNEQLQQGHPQQQSYPQQQGQGYSQPPEFSSQMGPPPYSELVQTTQPMPYAASAQQPTAMQPTNISQNTTVVVARGVLTQPARIYHGFPPDSYMAFSILTCLFCFWPLSIAAIIKSGEVNSANIAGDYFRAKIASESAKKLNTISLAIGIAYYVTITIYLVLKVG